MQIQLVYISVILIWTTTPLAIKWSTEVGYLPGVSARMIIAMLIALALSPIMRLRLPRHLPACYTYLAGGLGIYTSMTCAYWGAQYIPSGWISVIFGISPIMTSILAAIWLGERHSSPTKIFALFLSCSGLAVMVNQSLHFGMETVLGVVAIIVAAFFHAASMVSIKKINAQIQSYASMTGCLIVTSILYGITLLATGIEIPVTVSNRAVGSILYLSSVGSVIGFLLFFYLLKHISATRTSLIALITPICTLILGNTMNNEPLTPQIWLGTAMVLGGLLLFEFGSSILLSIQKPTNN